MSDRERLLDLMIEEKKTEPEDVPFSEWLADYLVSHGVTVQRWIPVGERLPKGGELAIVTYIRADNGRPASDGIAYRNHGVWYWRFDGPEEDEEVFVEITHWMPLPEPAKEYANE